MTAQLSTPRYSLRSRWMVVDDNQDILNIMQLMLEQIHEGPVECFSSPHAAIKAASTAPADYELVITDYEMPGVDGLELCRQLRALTPAIKLILTTGSGLFTEDGARRAGFCGILKKPFHPDNLRSLLASIGLETRGFATA